ncbi:cyanophycinase [Pontibacter chitinilyticus]|uniref:cyanophycinase n=1 Tax=Pontibacter chitinilyticus TaxID=2674989 RepID=UPI0032196D02
MVVPTASGIPDEAAKEYMDMFHEMGLKNVEVLDIRKRTDAMDPEALKIVDKAAGFMFTGGDQLRLTSILGGTPTLQLMKERYTYEDILVAGTSAGAAAMSTPMINEGETEGGYIIGDVRITTGLEFLKNVAIDTHFIERVRIVRMAKCIIATNPGSIGIRLEEDTAIYVTESHHMEVLGSGLITVIDGTGITRTNIYKIKTGEPFSVCDMRLHLLSNGETYTFPVYDQLHI